MSHFLRYFGGSRYILALLKLSAWDPISHRTSPRHSMLPGLIDIIYHDIPQKGMINRDEARTKGCGPKTLHYSRTSSRLELDELLLRHQVRDEARDHVNRP